MEVIARRENGGWSRQALSGNSRIAETYKQRKVDLRKGKSRKSPDPALDVVQRQLKDREAQITDLKVKLVQYEERFITMIRNAAVHGLTQHELEEPLPDIDRKGSKS
ncbi:hypothetical protein [Microvirga tunisiensis]|uniref:Uncharacterized protein n=1 Tax=Microvirga tunisiensis TaxID=2108360 RepID=A0A5N7MVM9_9HYPH|nr:hypothetical protein [Microvirga tunisiensis]MPR13130.1 hypothetical protein [Microvirga tunisiensis]MPR31017.1 hypothetical protein [Microvirga tunisiensis]